MRNLWLAVFSLVMSCTPGTTQGQKCDLPPPKSSVSLDHNVQVVRKIHLDSRFTPEEVSVIRAAAQSWVDVSGGIVKYEVVDGYKFDPDATPPKKIVVLRLKSTDPLTEKLGIEEDVMSGTLVTPGTVAIVLIVDRITDKDSLRVHVMRNLGTDLGLPSYRGKYPGVMNQDMDVSCPTKYDMILFCTRYVCDWKETSYCEAGDKGRVERL